MLEPVTCIYIYGRVSALRESVGHNLTPFALDREAVMPAVGFGPAGSCLIQGSNEHFFHFEAGHSTSRQDRIMWVWTIVRFDTS